ATRSHRRDRGEYGLAKMVPVQANGKAGWRKILDYRLLHRAAVVLGYIVVKRILVPQPHHLGLAVFAGPGGDGFKIGDNQVVGSQIQAFDIPPELQWLAVHKSCQGANAPFFGSEGQPPENAIIAERLHIEKLVRLAARKKIIDTNPTFF